MEQKIKAGIKVIVNVISKIEANTPYDVVGRLHHILKLTKRESEANLMAGYFARKILKLDRSSEEYKSTWKMIAAEVIKQTGK